MGRNYEHCRGCDYFRPLHSFGTLRICHYALDMGIPRANNGRIEPVSECRKNISKMIKDGENNMPAKIELDEKRVLELYYNKESDARIAEILGVSAVTVTRWRKHNGLLPHGQGQGQAMKKTTRDINMLDKNESKPAENANDMPESVTEPAEGVNETAENVMEPAEEPNHSLPFSSAEPGEGSDYYTYAGDMSEEDYDKMHAAIDKDRARLAEIRARRGVITRYHCMPADEKELDELTMEERDIVAALEDAGIHASEETENAKQASYGRALYESTRAGVTDRAKLSDFQNFILDRGYEFETEYELKAAYDRCWKARHDILLEKDEFLAETKRWNAKAAGDTYDALVGRYREKKLTASDIYQYARFRWCLDTPDAVAAYQTDREKWTVNNCGTEISEEAARIKVCEEWGFEASRVHIIGTPYYESTDWQFIRFDCAHMTWLWSNESLYQVYC